MDYVLNKLYGKEFPQHAVGLDDCVREVYDCVRNTVTQRRGHQCVLLGARGTGKSLVIHHGLQRALQEFPDQFLVIRINGLIQNEDRLALREIAKQLDRAIDTGDEPIEKPSMSLTLKCLNTLFNVEVEENDSKCFKSVVFVVEELERYAINHQVLAYELLDWCQSSHAGVAVIGSSVRMNVIDLLEKRNRSRNTARMLTLAKPSSAEQLIEIGRELLKPLSEEQVPLEKIAQEVFYTSNSVRHLSMLLLPYVLQTNTALAQPLVAERLLQPLSSLPELDIALVICAARAQVRFDTVLVNFVIVFDEWRVLAAAQQSGLQLSLSGDRKPGSGGSALRAVQRSWERLCEMGLLESAGTQGAQEDLRMYVPELDISDVRQLLPRDHQLYGWTSIAR